MKVEFKKYEKLIYKRAWHYALRYNLNVGDIIGEGYIIYRKAVKDFEPSWGVSFSTYLFQRLRALTDYCLKEIKIINSSTSIDKDYGGIINANSIGDVECYSEPYESQINISYPSVEEILIKEEEDCTWEEFIEYFLSILSEEGKIFLNSILDGTFDVLNPVRNKAVGKYNLMDQAKELLGWSRPKTERVYYEILVSWNERLCVLKS